MNYANKKEDDIPPGALTMFGRRLTGQMATIAAGMDVRGLVGAYSVRPVANGFILKDGEGNDFAALDMGGLEGLMRQWLDERINEIKEWDHQRRCVPAAAMNGSIK